MASARVFVLVAVLLTVGLPQLVLAQSGRVRPNSPETQSKSQSANGADNGGAPASNSPAPDAAKPNGKNGSIVNADPGDVISLDSTLVSIPLIVSDHSGRYLPSLSKNDFALYE